LEEGIMVEISDIPAEVRWAIATRSASALPWAYGIAFQKIIGKERFYKIAGQIWEEGGKEAKVLAEMLGLPTGNARDVDKSWGIIGEILNGPEIKWQVAEEGDDRVVTRITSCPFLNRAKEMGIDPEDSFGPCQAYCRSVVENLNPKYTQRFESGMCQGSPYCESVVELKV
jgi:hypothetical protein